MLADQRIFRLRMVKLLAHRGRVDLLPCRRVVAGLASALKFPLVRAGMAGVAAVEGQPFITRLAARPRRVALLALHLHVLPGQRIPRLAVIELSGLLPVNDVVALEAVLPQLAFVKILMAGHAVGR